MEVNAWTAGSNGPTEMCGVIPEINEIEKQTAEFKARLIEQMMAEDEEDPQGAGSREGRRTGQDETRYEEKDNSPKGMLSKKGKDKSDPPAEGTENAMTPPAIDSGTSRLPATPKVTGACDGLWNLRERVLGWFDPEGTPKTREKQRESKEGEGTSAAGAAGGSEDGLKRIVATLTRTLNKNQGYLANAKKKLTFDGANITEFLIDYENLAALLKWTEEEKMEHLGQHVSLSLGRDIMVIVASSGSWKETRNEMMRKYLKAEKMATEAELAAVQRKNYATYNDFLRTFTLVALRIPGVTDHIMRTSTGQQETEAGKQEKVYGKPREDELVDKATATKNKFRYQIPILTSSEIDGTLSKLLGTMVSVSFQTMLQASPRLLKGLRQLLMRKRVEVKEAPKLQERDTEEAEAPQGVSNLQSIPGGLGDLEKAFADIRLSLPDREGGEVMRAPPGTKLSFHALPVGKLKIQIRTHHTDAVRKYKPVGKKAKPVSILVETSREEAMEKEEKILRVIRERRATEGHRIPNDVADTMEIGVEGFLTPEETQLIRKACQKFHLPFAFNDHQKGRLDAKLVPPVRIHTVQHECWNDKGSAYEFGITVEVTDLLRAKIDSFMAEPTASPYANKWFVFRKPNKTLRWIQDMQKLNAVTIRDTGSLPQADLLAESHAGRSIYSVVDLYSGYDPLPLDARDRPYTAMHTPVGQLQMHVTPMGFTNAVAEAQKRMFVVAGDMFPERCEPYIDDNPVKGTRYKDETKVEPGVRKFVWDHLQDIKDLLHRFLVYNITASGPKSILAIPEVTILGFRCGAYGKRPDQAKTDKISQWPTPLRTTTEVRAFLGVVGFWRIFIKGFAKIAKPIRAVIREGDTMDWTEDREAATQTVKDILSSDQAYLFGRRFILRIDLTNVAGTLKNYKPIDLTVGRWIGFIWQFDYKVERIAGLRNRAAGLSRVCITPEGVEDAEPIDVFLEYEGGTLVVDNEMADPAITTGQLLIQTLEKGAPAVVAELREGPVTTVRRKEEKNSWGAEVGAREELMAMTMEGGRDAVMTLAKAWTQKECQYLVNLTQEKQGTNQKEQEFFLIHMYEGVFKEIGMLLVGNKQPTEVSPKAREEVEKTEEGQSSRQAGESSSRKRKLYVGFDHNLVVNRGGRKQGIRGPLPLREGEPIVLPSGSDTSSEEARNPGKRPRLEEDVPMEFIDLTSDEEEDEVTTPTREERGREEHPGEKKDKWIEEFGPEFSDWFDQWGTILRYQWIMKAREKLGRGEDLSPTTFFTERTLLQFQGIKRQMEQEMEDRARREAQRRSPRR
ncbi:hypothetical protein CBR_g31372 [Chara braunii]|uniref:Reverse transcriptase domain-containing protein n=1 Tax=Chara braunii TaxID=69332 RepID=A0A388LET3_CHABU|nr:hypothetical protein CBR_g31372 [Chara braunii]|eukprot:GBG80816.1 hypothetical protein CBR_g31372 [Chara braunii]